MATALFNQNSISYTTPVLWGFQGSALLGLGGKAGDFQSGLQYSVSLSHRDRGLLIDAAYYNGNAGGTAATPVPSAVPFVGKTIGAAYIYGDLTMKASFANYKVAGSFDSRVYEAGLSYGITPQVDVDGGIWFTSDGNHTTNRSLLGVVGGKYHLSKSTTLYAEIALVNNHGAMDTGLSINGALYGTTGTTFGTAVGIQHVF